jgi:DNA-binding SARP family transcriptional activator/tetratricopeptide (TPR) repeat protein
MVSLSISELPGDRMQVRLLGPVDVTIDGQARAINGLRRTALVAALALRAGEVVSADLLTELIWDSRPPPGAGQTLQSHVSQLRRFLGEAAVIRLVPPGYVLDLPGDGTDVGVAQRLIREGTTASNAAEGARVLRQAIGLWRGRPLAELAGWRWFDEQAWWLESLRAQATRALTEHRLALGDHAALVAELRRMAREQPLDEDLRRQLMLALYRSGRQAESLAAYRELRSQLVTELGIEPGADLRDLEQAILRHDPVLAWKPPEASAIAAPQPPTPRQLPLAVAAFSGRRREIALLDGLLDQLEHVPTGPSSGAPLIAVVSGTAGVGKTTLAVHWAHAAAERCPDGQLYANLRGFGPQVAAEPAEVLRGFLEALGVAGERVPAALDERAALYRSLLTGRRMLVVLDNARDAGQVRPLLPGNEPAVVLITSRNRLSGLAVTAAAQLLSLQVMTTDDAAELLALRLGRRRVGAEPEAVATVISGCARLPLALAIAAARAASEPDQPLAALAAELRGTENVLGVLGLDDGATDLRTVFSWSYRTLNPAAAQLFRLLAVHPGPDFTVPAAASLAAITRAEAHDRLVELVRASLISEHTPGRYQSHDLLRSYATELARRTDTDEDRRSALARTLGHYLHSAHAASVLLGPQLIDPPDVPAPPSGTAPEEPPDHDRAWAWLCAEGDVLLAATRLSAAAGFDRHTWHLTSTLEIFLQRLGRWQEQAEICELALTATRRLGDQAALAAALRMSSRLYARLGQWDHAYSLAQEGMHLYEQLQDRTGAALTHLHLGLIHEQRAEYRDAGRHALTAHDLYTQVGDPTGQALALNCLGWAHACLREYAAALEFCERALQPLQEAGDRDSEAGTWDSIGFAQHHLGRHDQARESYRRALALARHAGNALLQAEILTHLADTEQITGRQSAARHARQQALAILEQLNHPKAALARARLTEHAPSAAPAPDASA